MPAPSYAFPFPDFHTAVFDTPRKRAWAARQPDSVRANMIQHLLVEYEQFDAIVKELGHFHFSKGVVNRGQIFGVIGQYRTGKSFAVQKYLAPYQYKETPEGYEFPALYLEGADDWDASGMPRAVLEATGGSVRGCRTGDFREAAISRLIDHRVGLIVVEDMHLFMDKKVAIRGFFGFIHLILRRHLCSVIVVTTAVGEKAVRANVQVKDCGGFETIPVKGFNPNSKRGRAASRDFLNEVDKRLPFLKMSGLEAPEYRNAFIQLKMNTAPRMMNVIRSAANRAFEDGLEFVPKSYIEAAIRRQIGSEEVFSGIHKKGDAPVNIPVDDSDEDATYV